MNERGCQSFGMPISEGKTVRTGNAGNTNHLFVWHVIWSKTIKKEAVKER